MKLKNVARIVNPQTAAQHKNVLSSAVRYQKEPASFSWVGAKDSFFTMDINTDSASFEFKKIRNRPALLGEYREMMHRPEESNVVSIILCSYTNMCP